MPTHKAKQKKQKSHQANAQRNCNMDRQQHDRKKARTGNMGLASCGVKCLNSSAVFQFNFSAVLTVLCSEIANFINPQNVIEHFKTTLQK